MKALRHILVLLMAALALSSCGMSKVKDIAVKEVGIAYILPTSSRSMDAKLLLEIDNPARSFAVQTITGTVRYKEKDIAHFSTGSIELQGKSCQEYELPCTIVLADGASLLDVLVIAARRSLDNLKADICIQAALKKNGVLKAPYKFKDLDISQFTK